jgi:hypothetical protein
MMNNTVVRQCLDERLRSATIQNLAVHVTVGARLRIHAATPQRVFAGAPSGR